MKFRAILSHTKVATLAVVIAVALAGCEGEDGQFDAKMEAALAANDYPTLMALWRDKADAGEAGALVEIGGLFERGLGVVQNYSRAADEYRAAVALGESTAMVRLGNLYDRGLGVERNAQEALAMYTRAADLGDPMAEYRLGRLYDGATLGPADYQTAIQWYKRAANQGVAEAQMALANHFYAGFGDVVPQDTSEAAKWFRMAAEHGHPGAQFQMGVLHENGLTVPKSDLEAYAWMRLSAAQGHPAAVENLARLTLALDPETLEAAKTLSRTYWDLYVAPFQGGA